MSVKLVKSSKTFEDINRVVKQLIIWDANYVDKEITFKELDYEYVNGKLVYKIDFKVKMGEGVYEDLWARVDESDVLQLLREERLNEILPDENI